MGEPEPQTLWAAIGSPQARPPAAIPKTHDAKIVLLIQASARYANLPRNRDVPSKSVRSTRPRTSLRAFWAFLLLHRQNNLRQRIACAVYRLRIVGVYDSREPVRRIDGDFEEVQQIARARCTCGALCADHAGVVRCVADLALGKRFAAIQSLREIYVPHRSARIGCVRRIVDNIHDAAVSRDPRKQRRVCRRYIDRYGRRPVGSLIRRTRKIGELSIGPSGVQLTRGRVHCQ